MHADAGRALVAVTNARIRGEDASPERILSLIALALRAPAHHTSGIFWGVQTAPGAAQLSENVRLAIYGAALQTVIVDLLSGESSVRLFYCVFPSHRQARLYRRQAVGPILATGHLSA